MSAIKSLLEFVPVATAGGKAAYEAWKSRRMAPADVLATKPRPIDAGLRAMLQERLRQKEAEGAEGAGGAGGDGAA